MKYKWLNKNCNKNLIVFFNGWGMDDYFVSHLNPENYNVLMFYDYNSIETDFNFEELNIYEHKHLIAWSMGVMTATLFNIDYDSKTAINGTLKPIDNRFGIPEKIYELTLKNLNPKSIDKFIKNMFDFDIKIPSIKRSFDEQKTELDALKNYNSDENFHYDRIILSDSDKIIPTKNQTEFWKIQPNIKSGHSPFHLFTKWSELL